MRVILQCTMNDVSGEMHIALSLIASDKLKSVPVQIGKTVIRESRKFFTYSRKAA